MINTSTFDDLLILYLYDELKEEQKVKVEKRILGNESSLNSFVKLDITVSDLNKVKSSMKEESIKAILNYSRSINAH